MANPVRFYFDEHIPTAVADALRLRGIDVVRAQDVGLRQASDLEHWKFAEQEQCVIVTKDSDFLIGEMLDSLTLIHGAISPGEMVNHVEHW